MAGRAGPLPTVEKNFTKSQFFLYKGWDWLFIFDNSHTEAVELLILFFVILVAQIGAPEYSKLVIARFKGRLTTTDGRHFCRQCKTDFIHLFQQACSSSASVRGQSQSHEQDTAITFPTGSGKCR